MWKLICSALALAVLICAEVNAEHHVSCYYRNWGQYGKGVAKFLPEDIDPMLCSVIKFAFIKVDDTTFKLAPTKANDEVMLGRIVALKKVNPKLKVVIAVGGWSHEKTPKFGAMVQNQQTRSIFIKSVVDFLKKNKLDGVNYNWLYPTVRPKNVATDNEKKYFTALLKETNEAFKNDGNCFGLTASVSAFTRDIKNAYEIPEISKYVNGVDLIVHSLWGPWKKVTGSQSAMKGDTPTIIDAIEEWLGAGMPSRKISIDLPLYGRSFKLKSATDNQLGAPSIGFGDKGVYTRSKGILAYYEICSTDWTQETDWVKSKTETPFASKDLLWVSYENPSSLKYKTQHLLSTYDLNGITTWALDLDDFTGTFCNQGKFPLMKQVAAAVKEAEKEDKEPKIKCSDAVDIGFLLDSSGSVRDKYQLEKDFLKSIASAFGISKDGSRASVITFSYFSEHSIKLNEYYNTISFNAAVDAIPLMGYTTYIDRSLRLAEKEMFTKENGGRKEAPKLIVLITDGSQSTRRPHEHPGDVADELRKQGINFIVVGVGKEVDAKELLHLAGSQENLFISPSFEELLQSNIIDNVRKQTCPSELTLVKKEQREVDQSDDFCRR